MSGSHQLFAALTIGCFRVPGLLLALAAVAYARVLLTKRNTSDMLKGRKGAAKT